MKQFREERQSKLFSPTKVETFNPLSRRHGEKRRFLHKGDKLKLVTLCIPAIIDAGHEKRTLENSRTYLAFSSILMSLTRDYQ